MSTPSFNPDAAEQRRAIDVLRKAVLAREARVRTQLLHPRRNRVRIERDKDGYLLSLRKGEERLRLTSKAAQQLAQLLDVGPKLLERLRSISRPDASFGGEDTRLLDALLWHTGEDADWGFRVHIRDSTIVRVFSKNYAPIRMRDLVEMLEQAESERLVRLVRFDLKEGTLRLVVRHSSQQPVAIRIFGKEDPTFWYPGALLINQEDGAHAAVTIPALISASGTRVLPIPHGKNALTKRRHTDISPTALTRTLLADLKATATGSHFSEMGSRFEAMQKLRIASGDLAATLAATGLHIPKQSISEGLISALGSRNTSQFWLLLRLLDSGDQVTPLARFNLELGIGRLVWSRGKTAR